MWPRISKTDLHQHVPATQEDLTHERNVLFDQSIDDRPYFLGLPGPELGSEGYLKSEVDQVARTRSSNGGLTYTSDFSPLTRRVSSMNASISLAWKDWRSSFSDAFPPEVGKSGPTMYILRDVRSKKFRIASIDFAGSNASNVGTMKPSAS